LFEDGDDDDAAAEAEKDEVFSSRDEFARPAIISLLSLSRARTTRRSGGQATFGVFLFRQRP
jgi:hypothetical protein